jgi:uncharacterized protein (DUF342 family)
MSDSEAKRKPGFEIQVSPDRMAVTLMIEAEAEVAAAEVIAAIRELKLVSFDDGLVIEAIEKRGKDVVSVCVATGTAPVCERPGRIDYRVPVADSAACAVAKVDAGQMVATMGPPVAGSDGRDVFGQVIPHVVLDQNVQIGRNLTKVKGQLVADIRGNLRSLGNVLSVEPLLELRGDEHIAEPINFDGDMVVKGTLGDGCILQLSGSLTVGGAIESIQLKTGGSVSATGGVIGKAKGKYVVGGELRCRFISGGSVFVARDILVQSEITGSRIACTGRLTVAHGPIFGGGVAANGGILCDALGHPGCTPTIVEAGAGTACRSFAASAAAQIEANRKRVRDVRAKIEPLLNHLKNLTASQREKATELLYEAEELETATNRMVADLEAQQRVIHEHAAAEILVAKAIYAGVIVRFPGVETTFTTSFKGPLKLAPRKTDVGIDIVLIDQGDRSEIVLPSRQVDHILMSTKALSVSDVKAA